MTQPTDKEVEAVARGFYEYGHDHDGWPWGRTILGGKEYWLKRARAAIIRLDELRGK